MNHKKNERLKKMENELINKISIAELDPKKSYIVEINIDKADYNVFKNIKQGFEKIGITNVLFYSKDRLKITEVKDNSENNEYSNIPKEVTQ